MEVVDGVFLGSVMKEKLISNFNPKSSYRRMNCGKEQKGPMETQGPLPSQQLHGFSSLIIQRKWL